MLQALGLVGLATLLVRARERALRRRAEELEALVAERTRQLQDANAQLSELSVTDPLTSLANRRALEAHAEGEWRRIARAGGSLAFVMVDVDLFKAYNDSLGHMEGDACLRLVAARAAAPGPAPGRPRGALRRRGVRLPLRRPRARAAPRRTPSACAPRSRSSA